MTTEVEGLQESKPEVVTSSSVDVQALIRENEALKASKERILNESKDYKAKFQESHTRLESIEQEKLEKNGEFEVMLGKSREELSGEKERVSLLEKKLIDRDANFKISQVAHDLVDSNAFEFFKQSKLFKETVQYDPETYEIDVESVKAAYEKSKVDMNYLYKPTNIAGQASGLPKEEKPYVKPLSKMSKEELAVARSAALKQM